MDNNFKVYKNASVKVTTRLLKKDDIRLVLQVENEMPYMFPHTAYENKLLTKMDDKSLLEKFNGGTYVFLNGELIQYRDSSYTGFVRKVDDMKEIADVIGCSKINSSSKGVNGLFNSFRQNSLKQGLFLGGEGREFDLEIGELGEGGQFKNKLIHRWNPFSENIIVSLETERLVCTNGMVGMSSFVTNEVPIVNRFSEHLELVSVQLEPHLNDVLKNRFSTMAKTNISLHHMMKTNNLLRDRLTGLPTNGDAEREVERESLKKLIQITDSSKHLTDIYEPDVFKSQQKADTLVGDLTQFDVYNILTEASTHTSGTPENNNGFQKEANIIVFDELSDKKNVQKTAPISSDSDHRRAFFGK